MVKDSKIKAKRESKQARKAAATYEESKHELKVEPTEQTANVSFAAPAKLCANCMTVKPKQVSTAYIFFSK